MGYFLFVHGFGTGKDDRGLFAEIETHFPEHRFSFSDLNDYDPETGNIIVLPLEDQATRLEHFIATLYSTPDGIIAHSLGCLVSCLIPHRNFRHFIFLTPPESSDVEGMIANFSSRPGSKMDRHGTSLLARADGTHTVVPAAFWESRGNPTHRPSALYQKLNEVRVDFILAAQDQIHGPTPFHTLPAWINKYVLEGDHNFSGAAREGLFNQLEKILGAAP